MRPASARVAIDTRAGPRRHDVRLKPTTVQVSNPRTVVKPGEPDLPALGGLAPHELAASA